MMYFFRAIFLAVTCLSFSTVAADLLPFETSQLTQEDISSFSKDSAALFKFGDSKDPNAAAESQALSSTGCRVFPGDPEWPSDKTWGILNDTLGGSLIKTVPIAGPCYAGPNYSADRCSYVVNNWSSSSMHELDPTSFMSPVYQGETCVPTTNPNGTCTLGGFPSYVVNATTAKQVQLAVNFARNTGIRLVIRNTGHDFSGKSGGAGALSIWTHYLNTIQYLPKTEDTVMKYSGPAFHGGSGVIALDLYKAAEDQGLLLVGGEGTDVGILGGYIQGGGHSPMSSIYGLAADQVLSLNLVTADGHLVTASSTSNTDLFWALRGGGPSTWGVVTSVTIRAHPAIPVTQVSFTFMHSSSDTFWAGVKAYWKHFITYSDAGIYSYFFIFPPSPQHLFILQSFWAPNKTTDETAALLKPWLDDLAALNISVTPSYTTYPTPYSAIMAAFPLEIVQSLNSILGSRLFPRSSWEDPAKLNETFDAWSAARNSSLYVSFNIRAPNVFGVDNAVLPAWRETVLHSIQSLGWETGTDPAVIKEIRANMSASQVKWKAVSPDAGAYLGECDIEEVDWQRNFFGGNYERLLGIKRSTDPWGLFWARTGVGSEGMSVRTLDAIEDENGRLCWK